MDFPRQKNNPAPDRDDWDVLQAPPPMTPEQTVLWLEKFRRFMFEIWKKNPEGWEYWLAENDGRSLPPPPESANKLPYSSPGKNFSSS